LSVSGNDCEIGIFDSSKSLTMIKRCPSRELAPAITLKLETKSVHPLGNGSPGKIGFSMEGRNGPDRLGRGDRGRDRDRAFRF